MFDYEVKYQKGSMKIDDDMLSQNLISHYVRSILMSLDIDEIKTEQNQENVGDKKYQWLNA